jgi:hypothetical protein
LSCAGIAVQTLPVFKMASSALPSRQSVTNISISISVGCRRANRPLASASLNSHDYSAMLFLSTTGFTPSTPLAAEDRAVAAVIVITTKQHSLIFDEALNHQFIQLMI